MWPWWARGNAARLAALLALLLSNDAKRPENHGPPSAYQMALLSASAMAALSMQEPLLGICASTSVVQNLAIGPHHRPGSCCPAFSNPAFTINSVQMRSLPEWTVPNGQNVTLQCLVDISATLNATPPPHLVLFYKDDSLFYNVSSTHSTESFLIPHARLYHSGTYKCTVVLNTKEKTTPEYQLRVKGVPPPRVVLDKKEVVEGDSVTVNCSVPEERPPIHFIIQKYERVPKDLKKTKEKTSLDRNLMTITFPVLEKDYILYFSCQAQIGFGAHLETSDVISSEDVTVTAFFSDPKFHVSPSGVIMEGDQLHIKCAVQVTHLAQVIPEIIIQKDKAIVAHSKQSHEAIYSVQAMVEYSGTYTCKVEARRISKVSSIVVNITELFPKPQLVPSSKQLDQGEELSLWCFVQGAPPANFTIQKEKAVVSQHQNFTKIATKRDSGRYTCTAGVGNVVKESSLVWIMVCENITKPRIFHDAKAEVIKGQTLSISCQSTHGTLPIFYQLLKANDVLSTKAVSSYDPVVFTDNPTEDGEYQCVADNCHSHPEVASEVLSITVIAPVHQVSLAILGGEEVESGKEMVLRCFVSEGTGPITYQFYKDKENKPFYQTTSNKTETFWHKQQSSSEQQGLYRCTASNRASIPRGSVQSNALAVRVFLAPWKKGLIALVITGVVISALVFAAKCYLLKKAKAKQMPVEMARPAVPLLNSNNEKTSEPNMEANSHYGYSDDVGNHAMKPLNENKESLSSDVEYTEVEVSSAEPHQALERKGTETVYSEIRKSDPNFVENRYSRTEGSLDGT
ncbi:platelet endothelial cell adhesion molecule [Ctenodactylus gundi]